MSKINESVAYLHARVLALEKCHAMLSTIECTIGELYRYNYSDMNPTRAAVETLRMSIRAEQGKAWNDIAMWSPLDEKASKLVRKAMEKYVDQNVNYSLEHLLPFSSRHNSIESDALKAELRRELLDIPVPKTTVTVEVPIRPIDKDL